MKAPIEKPDVELVGHNGDAFAIMGKVSKALYNEGADKEYIDKYREEAMSGNYDDLLITTMKYVNVF
jgi:hypothetical protein